MPYIPMKARDEIINRPDARKIANAGELNFAFTCIINEYLRSKGSDYQHFNDVIGALEGAKLEVYRRLIAPYEDDKIEQNGDVYNDRNAVLRSERKERATAS